MSPLLINSLTFLSASLAVLGVSSMAFDLFFRHRMVVADRLNQEFRGDRSGVAADAALFKDIKQLKLGVSQQKASRWSRFTRLVEQSGLELSAERLVCLSLATGWLLASAAFLIGFQMWMGAIGFTVGFALPLLWVPLRRRRRISILRGQLPDAFDLMSRAIQAGQTVTSALQVVADNFDDLLAREFRYCHEQQQMGLPMQVALSDLARRTGVVEMRMFAVTLSVQRQSGGNPVEMLNNLATVIRKRIKLSDRVKALTGEGRMQALVLLLLPLLLFAVLFFLNREYVAELFEHPLVLATVFISELCGAIWIYKIVNFDY
jgi:tight adherence protein B